MFKFFLIAACVATSLAVSVPHKPCTDPSDPYKTLPEPTGVSIWECRTLPCRPAIDDQLQMLIGFWLDGTQFTLPVSVVVIPEGLSKVEDRHPPLGGSFPTTVESDRAGSKTITRVHVKDNYGGDVSCFSIETEEPIPIVSDY